MPLMAHANTKGGGAIVAAHRMAAAKDRNASIQANPRKQRPATSAAANQSPRPSKRTRRSQAAEKPPAAKGTTSGAPRARKEAATSALAGEAQQAGRRRPPPTAQNAMDVATGSSRARGNPSAASKKRPEPVESDEESDSEGVPQKRAEVLTLATLSNGGGARATPMKGPVPTTVSELAHCTMRSCIEFVTEHVSPELAKKVTGLLTRIDELGERAPDRPITGCDPIRARDAMKTVLYECTRMAECAEALRPRETMQVAIRIRDFDDECGPAAGSTFQLTVKASDEAPLETIATAIVEAIPDNDTNLVGAVTAMMATDKQDIESYFFDGIWDGNVVLTEWKHVHRIFDMDIQVVKVNVVLRREEEEEYDDDGGGGAYGGEQDEGENEEAGGAEHDEDARDMEHDGADDEREDEGESDETDDDDVAHLANKGYVPAPTGSEGAVEPSEDTDRVADEADEDGGVGGPGGDGDDGGDEAQQAAASQPAPPPPPPKKQGGRGKTKIRYLMDGATEALGRNREHIINGDIGLAGLVRTDGLKLCMMGSCENEVEPGVHSSFWRNFCASCSSSRGFCSQCGLLNDRRNSMSCIIGTKGCNPRAPINKGLSQRQILDRIFTDFKEKNAKDAPPSASR